MGWIRLVGGKILSPSRNFPLSPSRHFQLLSPLRHFPLSASQHLISVPADVPKIWTMPLIRGSSSLTFTRGLCAPYDVPNVDWRKKNALTPVKNQEDTDACAIFSIVASVESLLQIQTGKLVELSIQHVMNHLARDDPMKMLTIHKSGLSPEDVFDIFRFKGVTTEENLPYKGIAEAIDSTTRPFPDFRVKYRIHHYHCFTGDPKMILKRMLEMVTQQTFVVAVDASEWPLSGWNEDKVYSGPPTYHQTGHLVVVAGCGVHTDDTPYWLIRNSAGTDFGQNGYVKIKLGDNCFGIETRIMYPIRITAV